MEESECTHPDRGFFCRECGALTCIDCDCYCYCHCDHCIERREQGIL